ncbi:MAG: lipoyl(octanoyl) transferase LipB [Chloroflexota bacterium]|nr:lipoyl(octanoyl) transferase LipB [Chloroflexota bacterium]
MSGLPVCRAAWLGLVDYDRAWELQRALVERVKRGEASNTLLLLEHPHVYTLGRRAKESDLLADSATLSAIGATVRQVDRGGEATYHGPGQLVGYPILDLKGHGGPLRYVRGLEETLARTLAEFGIKARAVPGLTGVWVADEKVAAIGVRVSGGVTSHGFALNVNTDLDYFKHIVPCGIRDKGVTSMRRLLGADVEMALVRQRLVVSFGEVMGFTMEEGPAELAEGPTVHESTTGARR